METGAVRLEGFAELQRFIRKTAFELPIALKGTLIEVAEPVRRDAEMKAGSEIRNILSPTAAVDWWRMRVGVTARAVYVAPQQRGARLGNTKRRNLAALLMDRAMKPALDENRDTVMRGVEGMLDALLARNGFSL